ncbi:DUF3795 domain-containing protein [uncultured Desulfosarcina sp.]|uniref:DUF3795 domain-containing protein n=1 Tax=uncultured Desulfosarcina sp. TaxID=218289 RepID=UPI0029C6275B|nr:DUF3795 domain-containing protein [uncultured Desulfosarcina sp.]
MSMETFLKIREMGGNLKTQRQNEGTDYAYMTAPCGLPCFECYLYLAQFDQEMAETIAGVFNAPVDAIKCRGCRAEEGKCAHHPMECRVYQCIEGTGMQTCAECSEFPCEYLHPYRDQAEKWHNTKVYNLCRIKKLGLEKWAAEEAAGILDKYFYGTWTL